MLNELYEKRREQMFPKLAPAQLARLEAHGTRAATYAGEVLVVPGLRGDERLKLLEPGEFSGEMSTLRGVGGFSRIRVCEAGAVVAVDTARLREIVQTDAELSEILMRAFILRRMGLVASEHADVTLRCTSVTTHVRGDRDDSGLRHAVAPGLGSHLAHVPEASITARGCRCGPRAQRRQPP